MWVDDKNAQDPYNRLVNPNPPTTASVGAGGGAGGAGQPTGTQSNPSTQVPTQSTGPTQNFATVQDYLGANKTQGEDLGQKFTGSLDASANKEKSDISGAATQTQNDINAGTTNYDPNLTNTALTDPTKITNDPGQLNSFLKQWNAAYTGPSSFEASTNYTPAAAANTEAQQKQAEVGTAGGQQQLIQDQFGVYGQGNKGLDQAILQNSSYYPKVQDETKNFQGVQDYLTQQAGNIDTAATNAQTATDLAKTNTQNAFTNNVSNFQNKINAEVAAAQTNAASSANPIRTALASGDATTVANMILKANPGADAASVASYLRALNNDYGQKPDLSNQYSFNPAATVTAANAATAQDYANAAAYGKLTGVDYQGVLNPANAGQAGTYNTANKALDPVALKTYLQGQVKTQDTSLLKTPDLGAVSSAIGQPNILDSKNFSNVAAGTKTATSIIDAAKRNGMGRGANGVPNNLDNLYHQAAVALVQTANGGALNTANPAIAGILGFVRQLGTYLYGSPQY